LRAISIKLFIIIGVTHRYNLRYQVLTIIGLSQLIKDKNPISLLSRHLVL